MVKSKKSTTPIEINIVIVAGRFSCPPKKERSELFLNNIKKLSCPKKWIKSSRTKNICRKINKTLGF
ncbi:MAG: hypothetical protein ACJAT4_001500 [Granulosicoccus sp.]|jgi:hypothetical protein